MDDSCCILLAIENLRSNPAYQAAEALRRKSRGKRLAKAKVGSKEHTAICLLITTWISIAHLLKGVEDKSPFFNTLPICHMYRALKDEIEFLRKTLDSQTFARELEELYEEWEAWLDKMGLSKQYVTAMCGGMTARFG
jgi:phytoene/squalene synthetase